jgi:hypothetical protein
MLTRHAIKNGLHPAQASDPRREDQQKPNGARIRDPITCLNRYDRVPRLRLKMIARPR